MSGGSMLGNMERLDAEERKIACETLLLQTLCGPHVV